MSDRRPWSEFSDVDHATTPSDYVHLLDVQQRMAVVQHYKQRVRLFLDLHPGLQVLDAGTGTGEDAQEMAKLIIPGGQIVGLDVSQVMIDEARLRVRDPSLPIRFVQGDLHHVPFADEMFDRCSASRTFQHLADPGRALTELVRVTKRGGLLVIVEPDHETRVIDTPYPDITRRFLRFRNDGMRQPDIGHRLYALFKNVGLTDVGVEPVTRVTTDYETIRPVAHFIEGMRLAEEHGVVTAEEAEQWILSLEEAMRTGRFFEATTWFITFGRKPSWEGLEQVAQEIQWRGGNALPIAADVMKADEIQRLVQQAIARFGTIHVLVNNAGGAGAFASFEELSDEDYPISSLAELACQRR